MKQRFSSLDIKVLVAEIHPALVSLRLSNIYDLSSRIFLLKFAKPSHREQLLVDSGFRCHLTQFSRTTAAAPSAFVARLRKFLKTRRVTDVKQVGTDRVIEIIFSDGTYRFFLEFYAGGNVVLTDAELNILACLRVVSVEEGEEVRVGVKYMVERRQNIDGVPELTEDRVRIGLETALDRAKKQAVSGGAKKKKGKASDALRKALAISLNELPPPLLEHAFLQLAFDASVSIEDVLASEEQRQYLMEVLIFARSIVDEATNGQEIKGYIIARTSKSKTSAVENHDGDKENQGLMYEDFQPFRPKQYERDPEAQILEFDGFNATVDEFFSSIESQKLESRLHEREEYARRKLEAARQDHERRLGGLQQVQELNVRKAQAIEANLQRVQETIVAVNGLIAQGMDWIEIARLIEMEQARHNLVAEIIKLPLKLYENTVTLKLYEAEAELEDEGYVTDSEPDESADEDEEKQKKPEVVSQALEIDIDLALSPWSNARQYYDQKRTAATKEQKTLQASTKALKSSERKIAADLKKGLKEEKEVLRPVRKQFWFEKFYYFIASEGYLVLAGKDVQQSEILYRRYLSKGDAYVHANLNGAASVIVKNKPGMSDSPLPLSTLTQAGTFCVATSSAWDSKAVMAAWWVRADQVSKTGSTGDYLAPGLFAVKGQKNYLAPAQLLLGFGVMFQISEESKARHLKNRVTDDASLSKSQPAEDVTSQEENEVETDVAGADSTLHDDADANNDHEDADEADEHEHNSDVGEGAIQDEEHDSDEEEPEGYLNPLQTRGQNDVDEQSELEEDAANHLHIHEDKADTTAEEESEDEEGSAPSSTTALSTPQHGPDTGSTMSGTKSAPQVRGKHGKKAKMKTKYAHQDEEDRALALRLLGSTAGQEKVQAEAEKKISKEQEAQATKERRRQQHLQTQAAGKEAEEKRRQQLDHGHESMDPEEVAELKMLDCFVGSPLSGDEVLDALIVCAPWDALGAKFKWRVKLQPGAQKKGKAVREIFEYWNRQINDREKRRMPDASDERFAEEKTARREGELIKLFRDVEVVGVIPVVRLRTMISGAARGDKGKEGKGGGKSRGRGGKGSKRK